MIGSRVEGATANNNPTGCRLAPPTTRQWSEKSSRIIVANGKLHSLEGLHVSCQTIAIEKPGQGISEK
jgi:hypothetical protein